MFDNRHYVIFSTSELNKINFDEVLETSADTVRKSADETLTFVKWDGETTPASIQALTTKSQVYTHEEMLTILNSTDWASSSLE